MSGLLARAHEARMRGGARKAPRPTLQYSIRTPWLLLAPFLVLFLAFFAAPMAYALVQSLTSSQRQGSLGRRQTVFAGLSNYTQVLSDPEFLAATGHVLQYAVVVVPVMLVLSVVLSLLIDSAISRLGKAVQFVAFLPYAVPGVIAVIVWGFLYVPQFNTILRWVNDHGIELNPLAAGTLPFSFSNINVWMFLGYNIIVMTAAMRTVPTEVIEAARIDGASQPKIALRIKLPLIRESIILVLIFTLIGAFQLFNEPMILRNAGSGITSTYTPNLMAYTYAFSGNNHALAAAVSIILAVGTGLASFVVLRLVNKKANL